jgi:hypothetical protein
LLSAIVAVALWGLDAPSFGASSSGTAAPVPFYRAPPGTEHVFRLTYQSESRLNFGALFERKRDGMEQRPAGPLRQELNTELNGTLIVTVIGKQDQLVLVHCRIKGPGARLIVNGNPAPDVNRSIELDLARGFFVRMTQRGQAESLLFDQETGELSKGVIRAHVARTPVVPPH